jgi:hypothetical protein
LNAALFNRILWQAMKGETPYPNQRDGRDLRLNRKQLLEQFRQVSLKQAASDKRGQ